MPRGISKKIPSYRRKKRDGNRKDRAVVSLPDLPKPIDLGLYGSPESKQRYADEVAAFQSRQREANPEATPAPLLEPEVHLSAADVRKSGKCTIAHLAILVTKWVLKNYRKFDELTGECRQTRECEQMQQMMRLLVQHEEHTLVDDFCALELEDFRQQLVDMQHVNGRGQLQRWSRRHVNKQISRVVRAFKLGMKWRLVDPATVTSLSAVEPLVEGRTDAKDNPQVENVAPKVIARSLEFLPPTLQAMVQFQLFTGARPGEMVIARAMDIDMSEPVWWYVPYTHKTRYKGKKRGIAIGPKLQQILQPLINSRQSNEFLFSPREVTEYERAKRHAERRTPIKASNTRGARRVANPKRSPGDRYSSDSFRGAIQKRLQRRSAALPHWFPYQIRHTHAEEVLGIENSYEDVSAVLGHSSVQTSKIYAARNIKRAKELAAKVG